MAKHNKMKKKMGKSPPMSNKMEAPVGMEDKMDKMMKMMKSLVKEEKDDDEKE